METTRKPVLYMDRHRVETYYQQITSPDGAYSEEHHSIWPRSTNILIQDSSSGLNLKAYYFHQKGIAVREYIKSSNQFLSERHNPHSRGRDYVYFEEQLFAWKITLTEKMNLWVSEKKHTSTDVSINRMKHGHLFLIEGYGKADEIVKYHGGWSSLQMLNYYNVLRYYRAIEEINEFSLDPVDYLNENNYLVHDPCHISALYRVISTCRDLRNGGLISTLGYPIMIFCNGKG